MLSGDPSGQWDLALFLFTPHDTYFPAGPFWLFKAGEDFPERDRRK